MFKLSKRSHDRLFGVDPRLVAVVNSAIGITKVDFGVTIDERRRMNRRPFIDAPHFEIT
jgi:peptidoglycan L-alanyl-D-glutamate endopeptidase CwlK